MSLDCLMSKSLVQPWRNLLVAPQLSIQWTIFLSRMESMILRTVKLCSHHHHQFLRQFAFPYHTYSSSIVDPYHPILFNDFYLVSCPPFASFYIYAYSIPRFDTFIYKWTNTRPSNSQYFLLIPVVFNHLPCRRNCLHPFASLGYIINKHQEYYIAPTTPTLEEQLLSDPSHHLALWRYP